VDVVVLAPITQSGTKMANIVIVGIILEIDDQFYEKSLTIVAKLMIKFEENR